MQLGEDQSTQERFESCMLALEESPIINIDVLEF